MEWAIDRLRPDPKNREIFDQLQGDELATLVESVREHGLINPITIRPDGRIIAGEQRWRAAGIAGLRLVPVEVRDASEDDVELIRIAENLRRRTLKVSELARAIRREREIREARLAATAAEVVHRGDAQPDGRTGYKRAAQDEVAKAHDFGAAKVQRLDRLADLIPPLMALVDAEKITRATGYRLAQLPAEEQTEIAAIFRPDELADLATYHALKGDVQRLNHELADTQAALAAARADQAAEIRARLDELRRQKDAEIDTLQRRLGAAERWARQDAVHLALIRLGAVSKIAPQEYADRYGGVLELEVHIENDIAIAEGAIDWLRELARCLRARAHQPMKGVRAVK